MTTEATTTPPAAAPQVPSARMIATLGLVALVSGVLIVTAFTVTLPQIKENKRIATERAIDKTIPGAAVRKTFLITPEGLTESADPSPAGPAVYAAYDGSGKLLGVAAEGSARGYQDVIRLLYAWSPECNCINGYYVLRNNDTPGIGDKIQKDAAFLANFKSLDVRVTEDGKALLHPIVTVKHGTKTEAWQIDAISGATISSKAVGRALNESTRQVIPVVTANLKTLKQNPAKAP